MPEPGMLNSENPVRQFAAAILEAQGPDHVVKIIRAFEQKFYVEEHTERNKELAAIAFAQQDLHRQIDLYEALKGPLPAETLEPDAGLLADLALQWVPSLEDCS